MKDPFDKAVESLEDELENGDISISEFRDAMRDLRQEQQEYARDCAELAFNDAMGYE